MHPMPEKFSMLYRFAHKWLPASFFGNPTALLETLASPNGLEQQWKLAVAGCRKTGGLHTSDQLPAGLSVQALNIDADTCLVQFPAPPKPALGDPPECWFTVMLCWPTRPGTKPRYFTLEAVCEEASHKMSPGLPPALWKKMREKGLFGETMLGEWFADGRRRSLLVGCKPELAAFQALVAEQLERDRKGIALLSPAFFQPFDLL